MSNASRAELASDFALVSSDELLREYLGKIAEKINARVGKVPRTPEQVGDMLEVTAYQILANKLTNDELTSEMRGVLIRHAGEVAISPIEIEDMVAECNTVDSIRERLVALNQFYLGHADATARVRAFDWLRIRGSSPSATIRSPRPRNGGRRSTRSPNPNQTATPRRGTDEWD